MISILNYGICFSQFQEGWMSKLYLTKVYFDLYVNCEIIIQSIKLYKNALEFSAI